MKGKFLGLPRERSERPEARQMFRSKWVRAKVSNSPRATCSRRICTLHIEKTLVILKPEAACNPETVREILKEFLNRGFEIVALTETKPPRHVVAQHYVEHKDKDFFPRLVDSMSDKRVIPLILCGDNVVEKVRAIAGPFKLTDREKTEHCNTIRARLMNADSLDHENFIHSSADIRAAVREIDLWFRGFDLEVIRSRG